MNEYRLYFLDDHNVIQARYEFRAENDEEAGTIAALLCDTCSDVCAGYELWNYSRIVTSTDSGIGAGRKVPTLDEISEQRQQNLLDMEQALQQSHWHLSTSRKLLEGIGRLREGAGPGAEQED